MKFLRLIPLVLIFSAFTFPAKELKLQYSFKVGDQYDFVQQSKQTITQSIPGAGDMKTEVQMDGTMTFKIQEVTSAGAKIEAQFTSLKVVTASPMANMTMDSDGAESEKPNQMLKVMMRRPFFFTMTNAGKVDKVENAENIYAGLGTLGLDEATLASTKQAFDQTLSEKSLKSMLETGFVAYPTVAVKAGDTWKNSAQGAAGLPIQIDNTWTLTSVEGKVANLDADAEITTPDKEKITSLPNGLKSKSDLGGKQAMKSKIDLATGWPTEIKVLSEIKGKMIILAGSMVPEDMEIPMEVLSESTFTFTRK
jgi:hypothetical protein